MPLSLLPHKFAWPRVWYCRFEELVVIKHVICTKFCDNPSVELQVTAKGTGRDMDVMYHSNTNEMHTCKGVYLHIVYTNIFP